MATLILTSLVALAAAVIAVVPAIVIVAQDARRQAAPGGPVTAEAELVLAGAGVPALR